MKNYITIKSEVANSFEPMMPIVNFENILKASDKVDEEIESDDEFLEYIRRELKLIENSHANIDLLQIGKKSIKGKFMVGVTSINSFVDELNAWEISLSFLEKESLQYLENNFKNYSATR